MLMEGVTSPERIITNYRAVMLSAIVETPPMYSLVKQREAHVLQKQT